MRVKQPGKDKMQAVYNQQDEDNDERRHEVFFLLPDRTYTGIRADGIKAEPREELTGAGNLLPLILPGAPLSAPRIAARPLDCGL